MKRKWKRYLILLSVLTLVLGGCSQNMKVSAEEIIHNAIGSDKDITNYAGVSETKIFEGEELIEHFTMEENVEGQKRKIISNDKLLGNQSEVLNDGEKMLMYDKENGIAHEMDLSELGGFTTTSPREQFTTVMDIIQDSHTHELVGEEKILGFDTYHIQIEANESGGLIGDMEVWIDKKTWFIVKLISETGDSRTESTYTELDFSPKFTEDVFTIDIPDDVEIETLDGDLGETSVTLEEAKEALGQDFLLFSHDNTELLSVELYDFSGGELDRNEIVMNYGSKEGTPLASLSVFPTPEDMEIEAPNLEIRGNPAEYEEIINGYTWDEDGLRYSLLVEDPSVDEEEILNWTENMVLSSEE
ncbi:hypothetical protein SPD79_16610 [Oceanobacillus sp. SE10311]